MENMTSMVSHQSLHGTEVRGRPNNLEGDFVRNEILDTLPDTDDEVDIGGAEVEIVFEQEVIEETQQKTDGK